MQHYRISSFQKVPFIIKNLLIINGLFLLADLTFKLRFQIDLSDYLGLHAFQSPLFMPHQFVTHMFMHADYMHLGFNMLMLWFFGNFLENMWGAKRFLIFYTVCGLGAALLHMGVQSIELHLMQQELLAAGITGEEIKAIGNWTYFEEMKAKWISVASKHNYSVAMVREMWALYFGGMIGASGAVFGILAAAGLLFPSRVINIWGIFPVKVGILVLLLIGAEVYLTFIVQENDGIAHLAHLGGALFAYILIQIWKRDRTRFY